jgi:hypothetical protein
MVLKRDVVIGFREICSFLNVNNDMAYGCETWSLTLREEHRLRVFENRLLRRIFRSERDEVTGGWRKLHNEELHSLYSSPIRIMKSRKKKWEGHVARLREKRMHIEYWWEIQNERKHYEGQHICGWIILNWILEK